MIVLKANAITSFVVKNTLKCLQLNLRACVYTGKPIVLSTDGGPILCWHPEQPFPYEHTKPLPRKEPEIRQGDTELKVQYMLDEKYKYRPDGPTQEELMKIFHTTRHVFDPKPQLRYRKKNPPKDRESI